LLGFSRSFMAMHVQRARGSVKAAARLPPEG
jgi:hypothetical protein